MDERKVVDYFVVAGLPSDMQPVNEFSIDGAHLKSTHSQAPITDITVIFPSLGEGIPEGYTLIQYTPTGILADLNHGSLRSPEVFLCYRRGRDKPPLVDIGVMHEGKEYILPDSEVVRETLTKKCANVNNSAAKTFLTYRRAQSSMPCNSLVVTDIAVIITSKGETAPHAFCMIKKNLNKGLVGSDVFLCYKKSMNRANLITYKPGILLRYPFEDHSNLPLPTTVPMFCLPMGCSLEKWPVTAQQPPPLVSTFVLTVSDAAEKLYGSAVTFYERYPAENLTPEQKQALGACDDSEDQWTYNINKCICLLSRWPFFDTYEKFLLFLHEISCSNEPQPVPIERFITYFLEDVPFPSPQRPRIFVQLSLSYRVILTQPEDLPLPRSGASFRQLLMNLGPENCLAILLCALTEQKMLVHSLRPDVLTSVAEAISTIMFPFKWQCPYIPLCPLGLAEVLHAPLPFLIGVDSRFFDLYDPPTDVSCVDLDTNNITLCEEKKNLSTKILPKKASRALKSTLELLYKKLLLFIQQVMSKEEETVADNDSIDKEFQIKKKEQALELEIQEAFIRFMANVLKGYRSYLLPITKAPTVGTTDTNSLFDLQGFLRSRDKAHFKFFSLVTKTQMFIRFIEERSFVSDMDASLAFFDECTEKVDNEDESVHLLEVDESHYSERTVFIMPPETTGQLYVYEGFNLNPKLLSHYDKKNHMLDVGKSKGPGGRLSGSGIAPGSPMARRTKHEIKLSQRIARQCSASPNLWAKCLVGTCFSIWFIHLPSYVLTTQNPPATLRYAYDLLVKIHKSNILPTDEVCYRVMMQLCGAYSQPVVAVKLLFHMKRAGLQPNAITYGFYNRAVLEATWPSGMSNSSQLLWNKLRNVIKGAALFKKAGITAGKRRLSVAAEENSTLFDPVANSGSRTSIDSSESLYQKINGESGPWASQLCIHLPKQQRDPSTPIALQVTMTTCSKCHNCSCILYDEEIMAGWIPEDSNLNTKCQFCDKATVPLLSVTVTDFRNSPMPSVESERKISTVSLGSNKTSLLENSFNGSKDKSEPQTCEPITVPYLNPLVLRKEFESILAAEGDTCLTQPKFVDEHPIIYWNMVWMFTRIGVESHLPGLALGSAIVSATPDHSWDSANSSNVLISTMWHNARLHDEVGQPMYISWNDDKEQSSLVSALVTDRTSVPKSVMQKVISCLQCCNLSEPLKFLAVERQKLKGRGHSLYREILFLGITALGKENIDLAAYDREYIAAYDKLPEKDPKLYLRCDQPPTIASMFCRQYFRSLEL
ncbi:unnamed protein product [Nezara viridula]|uniref:Uncharacterized protein n=1 Tax=Nezara viridula TaxID=85310 RepID=A0A9P0HM12_NEZVI|nr:unnamed protein product [Nezara viridula]